MAAAIELACDRPLGWIAAQVGLIAEVQTVPEAIAVDPKLDDPTRKALLEVYEAAIRKL